MKVKKLLKIFTLSVSLLLSAFVGRFTTEKQLSQAEVQRIQARIERRLTHLKHMIDNKFGEGFFEEVIAQKITEEDRNNKD